MISTLKKYHHFQASKWLAEFLGTFAIVFFGCGSLMVHQRFGWAVDPHFVPLIFGLTVSTMIYTLGHISGAHFNPAVTLGFVIGRHFPFREMLSYWSAQFLGAISAAIILYLLLPAGNEFGATTPHLPALKALGWEILLTFFLMVVIMAVATDTRVIGVIAGAAIGMIVALNAFLGGPLTGASMNPARSLAPALFQGGVGQLWIYFLGPFIGSAGGALFYRWIRCDSESTKDAAGCC
ncbi:MAG: aquaporin NIP1-like [Bacteriovoracaceae bacterium]|nr:aquaporin NIP1-like [Bacteriovoracaceae bacterium]